jgi:hypothetical protein
MLNARVYSVHGAIAVLVRLVKLVVQTTRGIKIFAVLEGLLLLLQLDLGTFFQSEL